MSSGKSKILPLSALVLLTGLTFATSAQAEWRHGPIRRDERARFNNQYSSGIRTGVSSEVGGGGSSIDPVSGPRITSGGGRVAAS